VQANCTAATATFLPAAAAILLPSAPRAFPLLHLPHTSLPWDFGGRPPLLLLLLWFQAEK